MYFSFRIKYRYSRSPYIIKARSVLWRSFDGLRYFKSSGKKATHTFVTLEEALSEICVRPELKRHLHRKNKEVCCYDTIR